MRVSTRVVRELVADLVERYGRTELLTSRC
jgi:hypothetical protein